MAFMMLLAINVSAFVVMASPYGWPAKSFIKHVPASVQVTLIYVAVSVFISPVLISAIFYFRIMGTRSACWRNKVGSLGKDSNPAASIHDIESSASGSSFGGVYIGKTSGPNLKLPQNNEVTNNHQAISLVHSLPHNGEIILNINTLRKTLPKTITVKDANAETMALAVATKESYNNCTNIGLVRHLDAVGNHGDEPDVSGNEDSKRDSETDGGGQRDVEAEINRRRAEGETGGEEASVRDQNEIVVVGEEPTPENIFDKDERGEHLHSIFVFHCHTTGHSTTLTPHE